MKLSPMLVMITLSTIHVNALRAQDAMAVVPGGVPVITMANSGGAIDIQGKNTWQAVPGMTVTVNVPPGANGVVATFAANVTLRSASAADPHLAGYIRIVDMASKAVVGSGRVFMGQSNSQGRVITVPVHIEGVAAANPGSFMLGVEVMARDGVTRMVIENNSTQGDQFSPIIFRAMAVRMR